MTPKYVIERGVVWHKNPLKGTSTEKCGAQTDFYSIRTPTFTAYEFRLSRHMSFIGGGGGLNILILGIRLVSAEGRGCHNETAKLLPSITKLIDVKKVHHNITIGASQMTTKFLTIKFAKFPNFIVMEFLRKTKTAFLDNFP